jgi:hypothetical protein
MIGSPVGPSQQSTGTCMSTQCQVNRPISASIRVSSWQTGQRAGRSLSHTFDTPATKLEQSTIHINSRQSHQLIVGTVGVVRRVNPVVLNWLCHAMIDLCVERQASVSKSSSMTYKCQQQQQQPQHAVMLMYAYIEAHWIEGMIGMRRHVGLECSIGNRGFVGSTQL